MSKNENKITIQEQIFRLKRERNAIILAHYYQIPEIQDIADYIGDSLGLSQQALTTEADVIVFAGVHFMAETAKILNPHKTVLIPDLNAGCSLADSCPPDKFNEFIGTHPDHLVISYINCSARIKTMSDIICTSGNAVKIVESLPKEQNIIFAPDRNLGHYINMITGRRMILWDGSCEVHDIIRTEAVVELKRNNPDALLIAHPECKAVILEMADFVGSTAAMLNFTIKNKATRFIVSTETGIIHQMKKASPSKEFIIVPGDRTCSCNDCPYMKMNTLDKILNCLQILSPEISLPDDLISQAKKPILRMLELSKQ